MTLPAPSVNVNAWPRVPRRVELRAVGPVDPDVLDRDVVALLRGLALALDDVLLLELGRRLAARRLDRGLLLEVLADLGRAPRRARPPPRSAGVLGCVVSAGAAAVSFSSSPHATAKSARQASRAVSSSRGLSMGPQGSVAPHVAGAGGARARALGARASPPPACARSCARRSSQPAGRAGGLHPRRADVELPVAQGARRARTATACTASRSTCPASGLADRPDAASTTRGAGLGPLDARGASTRSSSTASTSSCTTSADRSASRSPPPRPSASAR